MTFHSPAYLFLLLLLIPVIGWYVWRLRDAQATLRLSDASELARRPRTLRVWLIHVPFALRVLTVAFVSIALARPQLSNRWQSQSTEGIDIMMALDVSGTMLAEDLKPNRLEAAKEVATDFVINRPNDNIGLVVFAGDAVVQLPITNDFVSAKMFLESISTTPYWSTCSSRSSSDSLRTALPSVWDLPTA